MMTARDARQQKMDADARAEARDARRAHKEAVAAAQWDANRTRNLYVLAKGTPGMTLWTVERYRVEMVAAEVKLEALKAKGARQ